MNSIVAIAFFACVAAANAGWLAGPSAKVLQGPSSKTTVVGPDGSAISAIAPGGQIVHEEHPGVIAHAAPVYAHAAPVYTHAAPVLSHAAHAVSYAAPVVAHAAPATVIAHSAAHGHADTIIAGPSGTIATGHAAHGSVIAHAAPVVAHAAPVVAHAAYAAPIVAYGSHDDNGYEGQYLHDHSETLYDDGSYKPHYYH